MRLTITSTSTNTLVLAASVVFALSAGVTWAQGGVRIENGVRFPDGTVQMTSAQPTPVTVRETGMKPCFDASGVEVACAGSGHDGDARPGMEWSAAGRFVDVGDGTVIDQLSGLMWLRDAGCIDSTSWEDALATVDMMFNAGTEFGCLEYTPATFDDWRLPSILELASLIDYGSVDGLPAGHPFADVGVGNCHTWSSTTQLDPEANNDLAWGVPLAVATASPHQIQGLIKNNPNNCVLPVRNQDVPPMPIDTTMTLTEGGITFGDGSRQASAPMPGLQLIRQTGQTTCFNNSGLAIQCVDSGQDGETQNGIVSPQPRFVDNGDGTVKDEMTGLTWLKDVACLGDLVAWEEALGKSEDLSAGTDFGCTDYMPGSLDGWRLPTITEQLSLFDFGSDTGLPVGHPFDFSGGGLCQVFWSSTTNVVSPDLAWRLFIGPDATFFSAQAADKNFTMCVWPVREG